MKYCETVGLLQSDRFTYEQLNDENCWLKDEEVKCKLLGDSVDGRPTQLSDWNYGRRGLGI